MKSHQEPSVYIIILYWNSKDDIFECIGSILKQNYRNYKIVIVDNGSTDNGIPGLKEKHPSLIYIDNKKNLGYAAGNNVGMKYAFDNSADYIIILNPDTAVEDNWLIELINSGENNPDVGIIGSKLIVYSNREIINSCGHYLNCIGNAIDNGYGRINSEEWNDEKTVQSVCGASFAIKRRVIEKIGYLDPVYFNYYEDVDYGIRARFAGFNILVNPKSVVYHKVSIGTKGKREKALFWSKRNQYLFMLKFFPLKQFFKYFPLLLYIDYKTIYNNVVFFKNYSFLKIVLKAFTSAIFKSPAVILKKIKQLSSFKNFDLFNSISLDATTPSITEIHPDYEIFNPDKHEDVIPSRIIFGFNDQVLGYGWYNLYIADYIEDELIYRWFGKRAHTYLKVDRPGKKIIQIHVKAPLSVLQVPKLIVYIDDKKIGESRVHSHNGEWNTLHFPCEKIDEKFIKVTLEVDDFVSIKNRGFTGDFGCIVNEVALLDEDSPLLRNNLKKSHQKAGLHQNGHLLYEYKMKDYQYEMVLIDKTADIKGRNYFHLKVRVKNTSSDPWLMFHHSSRSYVLLGMRLYDAKSRLCPRYSKRFALNKNLLPGEETTMTLHFYPILHKGTHTIRLDMVEEYICWFEKKGAKPLDIEVDL